MTASAPPRIVRFEVSEAEIKAALGLGDGVRLVGAAAHDRGASIAFYLEHPAAPDGADEMRVDGDGCAEWYRSGHEITR